MGWEGTKESVSDTRVYMVPWTKEAKECLRRKTLNGAALLIANSRVLGASCSRRQRRSGWTPEESRRIARLASRSLGMTLRCSNVGHGRVERAMSGSGAVGHRPGECIRRGDELGETGVKEKCTNEDVP
jgi:hypothetical protein